MLPDIEEQSWVDYQRQELERKFKEQRESFTLDRMIGDKVAELQRFVTPQPAPEAAPEPQPIPEPAPAAEPVGVVPPQAEPPQPMPSVEPPQDVSPVPSPVPGPSAGRPRPAPSAVAEPAPQPSVGAGPGDWIAQSASAAGRAGGDVGTYLNSLRTTGGDRVGGALSAALRAGADPNSFMANLPSLPVPTPAAPAAGRPPAAPGGQPTGGPLSVDSSSPEAFIRSITPAAREVEARTGIPAEAMIGMAANETGFGKFAGGNNLFGIKGKGPAGSTSARTWEDYGQGRVDITDSFRAYNDPSESFQDFADLITAAPRYAKAVGQRSVEGFVGALKAGGYMTDPNYVGKIRSIVDRYQPAISDASGSYDQPVLGGIRRVTEGAASAARGVANQISQFGDSQLTADEAYAACGPAAAVRFASMFGRNPSLREATDLAKQVGWSSGAGMAGIASEQKLMEKLGVPTRLLAGAQWDQFAREAQSGNPVTISTPGHYFFADGYDPTSGAFHVGKSGTDLKGGSEWMTPSQMEARMGQVQGGLLADNPQVPAPSTADRETNPSSHLDRLRDTMSVGLGEPALTDVYGKLTPAATGLQPTTYMGAMQPAEPAAPAQSPVDRLKNAFSDFIDSVGSGAGNLVAAAGGGLPAAAQPTPSDSLTNPLGSGNAAQSASSLAPLDLTPPSSTDLGDALRSGGLAQAIAENQANPPLAEPVQQARDLISNAPVLGGALGMLRGPDLLSESELLRSREAPAMRRLLEQGEAAGQSRGLPPREVTDHDVAEAVRATMTAQAVAMTGAGFGRPGEVPGGQLGLGTDFGPTQPRLPEGGGRSGVPEITREVPSPTLEQVRMSDEARRLAAEREAQGLPPRQAGVGEQIPEGDLSQTGMGAEFGVMPRLKLPGYVGNEVSGLLEKGNQAVNHGTAVDDTFVQNLADRAGESVERIRKAWKPSDESDAVLRSASKALEESSDDLVRAQGLLKKDPTDSNALAGVVRQLTRHQALQEAIAKRRPEAASILEDMRGPVSGLHAVSQQMEEMARRAHMTPELYAEKLAKVDMLDPAKVANLAQVARSYTFTDKLSAVWYFNLLSSPTSHIRNIIGNSVTALTSPLEAAGAAGFDPLARKLLGSKGPRERYLGESGAQYAGMWDALGDAGSAALDALRYGTPSKSGELGRLTREPFGSGPLEFLGYPGRMLEAEDQAFRTVNRSASLRAEAYRRASQEGLSGNALKDRVTQLVKSPDDVMQKAADATAEYRVFQQNNAVASKANQLIDAIPGGRLVVPFVRTPLNIMLYALERSPLAATGLLRDAATKGGRQALVARGSGDLADRLSRMTLGSSVMGAAIKYASDGNLTGRAPGAPGSPERDAFYRQGKQPFSIRNPLDGKWYSYQALQPFSTLLGASADIAAAYQKGQLKDPSDIGALALAGGQAVGQGLLNTPWVEGASDLFSLFNSGSPDMGGDLERMAKQYASNAIPGAALWRSLARMTDNVIRDPGNPLEAIQANLPGLQGRVPAALDAFGQPRTRPSEGLESLLFPFPSTEDTRDPVELELKRLQGLQVGDLPKQLGDYRIEPGFVGKDVTVAGKLPTTLTDDQQRHYQELAGQTSYNLLAALVGTSAWNKLSDLEKAQTVDLIYTRSRALAQKQMDPELAQQAVDQLMRGLDRQSQTGSPLTGTPAPAAGVPAAAGVSEETP